MNPPNDRAGVDAGLGSQFVFGRSWPGTTQHGCYCPFTPIVMRALFALLLVCCWLGCRTQPPTPVASRPSDPINPATPEQLEQAKQRIHLLRAVMTDEQVFATLSLSSCYGRCFANAGGSTSHLWVSYTLRNGHALHVVHDATKPGAITLRSVSLDQAIWKRDEHAERK